MKAFELRSSMLAPIGGAFYPTGHTMLMFETEALARDAASRIIDQRAASADAVQYIPPQVLLDKITPTVSDSDNPLPSAGTDAATVRAYTELARKGHSALLVATPNDAARDALMAALDDIKPSMAQRYRTLVIEDL